MVRAEVRQDIGCVLIAHAHIFALVYNFPYQRSCHNENEMWFELSEANVLHVSSVCLLFVHASVVLELTQMSCTPPFLHKSSLSIVNLDMTPSWHESL